MLAATSAGLRQAAPAFGRQAPNHSRVLGLAMNREIIVRMQSQFDAL